MSNYHGSIPKSLENCWNWSITINQEVGYSQPLGYFPELDPTNK